MQRTAKTAQPGTFSLADAINGFHRSANDLGDDPTAEQQNRLSEAFDTLAKWTAPAESFRDAVAALRLASDEFRMGQEGDGIAKAMLDAALGFLNGANASLRPLPARRRWTRRASLKVAA